MNLSQILGLSPRLSDLLGTSEPMRFTNATIPQSSTDIGRREMMAGYYGPGGAIAKLPDGRMDIGDGVVLPAVEVGGVGATNRIARRTVTRLYGKNAPRLIKGGQSYLTSKEYDKILKAGNNLLAKLK